MQTTLKTLAALIAAMAVCAQAGNPLPKGLMLNLDFQKIENGLIPNKTLYPLYVPIGDLGTITNNDKRVLLMVEYGQGLDIPHSSLLDPDGGGWVATVRVFAMSNGLVMSQGNDENGYAIHIKDGAIHAAIHTGYSTVILKERPENGITECLNKWVTIELKLTPDMAILILNRAHVAIAPLQAPFIGEDYRIRVGEHKTLPAPLRRDKTATTTGFTGGIRSLKVLRQ
ncbi:MAG: LamG domain-containing protein [Verrucomicrobiota bacterium]